MADIYEKLDTLINRLSPKEKKLNMEGKIYFLSRGVGDNWTTVVVLARLGYYYVSFFESRVSKPDEQYLSIYFGK